MNVRAAERTRQEIMRLSHAGLDSKTFRVEAVKQLRKAIPVDVSFFATADPAKLLFTSALVDDVLARATGEFLENEFLRDDSVKFASLARNPSPVGSLGAATKGELARSARYQEILAPMNLGGRFIVGSVRSSSGSFRAGRPTHGAAACQELGHRLCCGSYSSWRRHQEYGGSCG